MDERDVFQAAGEGYPAELVGIELRTECPKCGVPLPVDGLERDVTCRGCSAEVEIDKPVFAAALDSCYSDVYRLGRGVLRDDHAEVGGRDVHWLRGPGGPPCAACGLLTRPSEDGARYACPAHGDQGAIEPAPAWLKSIEFTLEGYVAPRPVAGGEEQPQKVSTRCTNCGSALESDGSKRAVTCGYCNTINVLPEEVWQALNPPRAPQRFWVMARLFYDPRRETPSAWAEIKEGLGTIGCGLFLFLPVVFAAVAGIIAGSEWLVETFGQGGVTAIWIGGGLVLLGLLIYVSRYIRRYLRWRKIYRAEQELVGRVGPFKGLSGPYGMADVSLGVAGQPETAEVAVCKQLLTRDDYDRLGGEGGAIRAWMVPGRADLVEIRLEPSALE